MHRKAMADADRTIHFNSVKSLVREFDVVTQDSAQENGNSAHSSPSGSTSRSSSAIQPALGSKSSMTSLLSPSTPETSVSGSTNNSVRKTSNSSVHYSNGSENNGRQLDYGSHGSGQTRSQRFPSDVTSYDPLDTPALEQLEESDVFLPMSPFTPGYSMSGSSTPNSPARRESRVNNGPPPSMSQMTAAERREHSRKHSTVHARNLSVFFPRPEQQGQAGYQGRADEDDEEQDQVALDIPGAETRGWGYANGQSNKAYNARLGGEETPPSQPNSRRGHHHRHSMSHNFFPFIDTTQSPRRTSNSSLSPNHPVHGKSGPVSPGSSTLQVPDSATSPSTPRSVPSLSSSTSRHRHTSSDPDIIPSMSLRTKYSHLPSPVRLILGIAFHLPLLTQISLLAACTEVGLGASLWIAGQSGESLAVTGLGYLVVFDGLAALSSIMVEGNARGTDRLWDVMQGRRAGDNGVRYPFGWVPSFFPLSAHR